MIHCDSMFHLGTFIFSCDRGEGHEGDHYHVVIWTKSRYDELRRKKMLGPPMRNP